MNQDTNTEVKGAEKRGDKKTDIRPTWDQIYLASRLYDEMNVSIPALQKLNNRYGVVAVTDALRLLRGFPPEIAVRSPYAYVAAICKDAE